MNFHRRWVRAEGIHDLHQQALSRISNCPHQLCHSTFAVIQDPFTPSRLQRACNVSRASPSRHYHCSNHCPLPAAFILTSAYTAYSINTRPPPLAPPPRSERSNGESADIVGPRSDVVQNKASDASRYRGRMCLGASQEVISPAGPTTKSLWER